MISRVVGLSVVFVIVSCSDGNKYCKLSCDNSPNTVCEREQQKCGAGPLCGSEFQSIKLTDADRQRILDTHNALRNKVAAGNQKPQPSAANMKALSYNKELEFIAQCWANSCNGNPLKHDTCRRTAQYSYVGQNLAWWSSTSPNSNLTNDTINSIMSWFNEVKDFDASSTDSFQPGAKVIGHYTQLVWANTLEIGCAISSYSRVSQGRKWYDKILACNYGPGGNYFGTPVYQRGQPASQCSGGKPNKKYNALCGEDRPLTQTAQYKNDFFKVSI